MTRSATLASICFIVAATSWARADGPSDNVPKEVRRVPKAGVAVPSEVKGALDARLAELGRLINGIAASGDQTKVGLLPDVQIFEKAVHDALAHDEFFDVKEFDKAAALLAEGIERAQALGRGEAPWTTQTGLVVRGYVSRIDGSVQPFGLVVPASYTATGATKYRLDLWFHGRGEMLSEVNFLQERQRQAGTFTPADTFVLHPYGRYCNAFRFAGEVDVLEALDAVQAAYRIDPDRISSRGFSMGGAAAWQFAVHQTDRWFAANPGAGFSETARFLNVFQNEQVQPSWYERKLWHLYDCTDYAANLLQCPTVAYSGEIDRQKQAADVMAEALKEVGVELKHVIGPKTAHAYEPRARVEVERIMDLLAVEGRRRMPLDVTLVTYTLKYNRMNWVTIDALDAHWERARVHAAIEGRSKVTVDTENVDGLTLDIEPGLCPLDLTTPVDIEIDGLTLTASRPLSDRSWHCRLARREGAWTVIGPAETEEGLRKRHDLQGPIDDAFMGPFVFVKPTGKAKHEAVGAWAESEFQHAVEHWRRQFRGDARVVDDTALSDEQIAGMNLVLWGTPESNSVLRRIADRLPIRWDGDAIAAGGAAQSASDHALVMIYPNPLNPQRYVVLNSGFTYREYDYLNNARQVPKLPDWAIIDVRKPADSQHPGGIADAGFFGEAWQFVPHKD